MPIRTFDSWAAGRVHTFPLSVLKEAVIGIEAAHYLSHLLRRIDSPLGHTTSQEPLLSALGGVPLALGRIIEQDLEVLDNNGIRPVFVFSGMDIARKDNPLAELTEAVRANAHAWELYDRREAEKARDAFAGSGAVKPENLFRYFQRILKRRKIEYMVAPYTAWGQLAYLENEPSQFIDAIAGSSDLFLFNVDKVITELDFSTQQFSWLSKRTCQDELGRISADIFVDACLLSGCSFLPTFPPLENPNLYPKSFTIRDSINLITSLGRSVTTVCNNYQDDARVQQLDYLDRYRRGLLAVKHHVVLTKDGKVEPLHVENAPGNAHEFLGQRLPDELYFYLSRGVIGPRLMNWLASGEIQEGPPLDGGEGEEYRTLVLDQLTPLRTLALSLLSHSLFRSYQFRDISIRYWFDRDSVRTISLKEASFPREITASWNVKESLLETCNAKPESNASPLAFAINCLSDESFATRTVTKKDNTKLLSTQQEILLNTIWRLMHLRGYVDNNHKLTTWGRALLATVSALDPNDGLEEAAFLAIEILRLGLLNSQSMFASYTGSPTNGSDIDKRNCMLVSRVACFGNLKHERVGFTGPLSRSLLAYQSIISTVRQTIRDVLDSTIATLLLNGDADRSRTDWTDLGLSLPFLDDNNCGLAVAVKSYLDELAIHADPTVKSLQSEISEKMGSDFRHTIDYKGCLDMAFRFWDAVYQGVKIAGKDVKDAEIWAEADTWLSKRR